MSNVIIREPTPEDKEQFTAAMQRSQSFHHPWAKTPVTSQEFDEYFQRYQQPNHKSFLVCDDSGNIAGVFNISEIVRGVFQNAYLGYYVVSDFAGKGYMSAGLKLVLAKIFNDLKLHRIEANIQPDNIQSIQLVKKNGFRYEGFSPRYLRIDNEWRGHEHWAITVEDFIRDNPDTLKRDHVDIVDYDPAWPEKANSEINKIRDVLPANKIIDIQHVGSTAIPGMAAKPIVDIQIAVNSLDDMKAIAIPLLQKLGYEYWYENPDPERMFFVKGMPPYGEKRTHHVHIVEPESKHWSGKILFRDYLISHSDVANEYQQIKRKLAQQYTYDREEYTNAKGEFVNKIVQLAQQANAKASLIWITDILYKHHIPFQITGGLAASLYGSNRPLEDIDIDIPEDKFELIKQDVEKYIVYGPSRFKSDKWDLLLMTLKYNNQDIDLGGAHETKIFNEKTQQWHALTDDLSDAVVMDVFGVQLPVISRENLLAYKKILARKEDVIDVRAIEGGAS